MHRLELIGNWTEVVALTERSVEAFGNVSGSSPDAGRSIRSRPCSSHFKHPLLGLKEVVPH